MLDWISKGRNSIPGIPLIQFNVNPNTRKCTYQNNRSSRKATDFTFTNYTISQSVSQSESGYVEKQHWNAASKCSTSHGSWCPLPGRATTVTNTGTCSMSSGSSWKSHNSYYTNAQTQCSMWHGSGCPVPGRATTVTTLKMQAWHGIVEQLGFKSPSERGAPRRFRVGTKGKKSTLVNCKKFKFGNSVKK